MKEEQVYYKKPQENDEITKMKCKVFDEFIKNLFIHHSFNAITKDDKNKTAWYGKLPNVLVIRENGVKPFLNIDNK